MRVVIDISEYDKEWIGNAYGIPQEINTKIAEAIINAEPCQPESHWIPIDLENNEPPLEEWVLVSSDGYVMQDCIVERGGRKIWYHGGNIQDDDRYMPLPEPFKGVTT